MRLVATGWLQTPKVLRGPLICLPLHVDRVGGHAGKLHQGAPLAVFGVYPWKGGTVLEAGLRAVV
jgi:hypothetical protein